MAKKLEDYIPVVKYHGLQTDKAVVLGSTLAVTGAITATGGVAGGVTGAVTGTTGTFSSTLDVTGATTLGGATNFKRQVTDTGGAYATPIVLTTAQSGRVILVDDAAGLDFTLPAIAAADIGTNFLFLVTVAITSNALRITAATGDVLAGALPLSDFDTADKVFYCLPDGTDLIFTANGTTTGGKIGTWVEYIATSATQWTVRGYLWGDGTLANCFS